MNVNLRADRESEPRERALSESYVLSANLRAATHSHTHTHTGNMTRRPRNRYVLANTRRFVLQRSQTVLCAVLRVLALPRNSRPKSDAARVFSALYVCVQSRFLFLCVWVVYVLFQMTFVRCAAGCVERCAHWLRVRAPMTGGGHLACALLARSVSAAVSGSEGETLEGLVRGVPAHTRRRARNTETLGGWTGAWTLVLLLLLDLKKKKKVVMHIWGTSCVFSTQRFRHSRLKLNARKGK